MKYKALKHIWLIYLLIISLLTAHKGDAQIFLNTQSSVVNNTAYSNINVTGSSYYSIPDSAVFDIGKDDPLTVEFWVKFNQSDSSTYELINKDQVLKVDVLNANIARPYLKFTFGTSSGFISITNDEDTDTYGSYFFNDVFYHVVFTYDGSESQTGLTMYVNGKLVDNETKGTTGTLAVTDDAALQIGDTGADFDYSYLKIHKAELSASEVLTKYNSGIPNAVKEADLNHVVRFDSELYGINTSSANVDYTGPFPGENRKFYKLGSSPSISLDANRRFGGLAGFDVDIFYTSPIAGDYRNPMIYYDSTENATYFVAKVRGSVGFDRSNEFFKFDHNARILQHLPGRLESVLNENTDSHLHATIIKTKDGGWLLGREEIHNLDAHFAKTFNFSTYEEVSDVSNRNAYLNLFYLNDSLRMVARTRGNTSDHSGQQIFVSPDDGASWTGPDTLLDYDIHNRRSYPFVFQYDETRVFNFVLVRKQPPALWTHIMLLTSTDGRTWSDLGGNLSKNIYTESRWTQTELLANAVIDSLGFESNSTRTLDLIDCIIDSTQTPHLVYHNTYTDSTFYATWNGSSYTVTGTSIPAWAGEYRITGALIWKGSGDFDLFKIETRGGYDVIVKYETTDSFASIDAGVIVSEPNRDYSHMAKVYNHKPGRPVLIAATEVDPRQEQANLWIYEYTPN